ncbi:MAG: hypothetical protein WB474_12470 [Nitrososphaeraceae archaeon]
MNSVFDVLKALSDPKVLAIFNIIALSNVDRVFLLSHLNLSTRACHYRVSRLLRTGVISRKNGKYSVTSFGLLVHHAQNLIGLALNSYWKLSAIDSLESSHSIPRHEYNKIVSNLLSDDKIKEILTRERETINIVDPRKSINSIPLNLQTSTRRPGQTN